MARACHFTTTMYGAVAGTEVGCAVLLLDDDDDDCWVLDGFSEPKTRIPNAF